jgi:hypothetical protein
MCGMANGGQCGLDSGDSFLSSLLNALTFIPTEYRWPGGRARSGFCWVVSRLTLLPSHARPLDQPPRLTF